MERIKKALERARNERERAQEMGTATPRADENTKISVLNRATSSAGVQVEYTQTKTVGLNADRLRERRIIAGTGQDAVADTYNVLRTQVLQRMRKNGWRTLAITSPGKDNGKTVTAINLGISLARDVNQTVLLVDLDLKHPSIGTYFLEEVATGLGDYLSGACELGDVLINPGIERLVIMPGRESLMNSSEMLSTPTMTHLVEELKSRYPDRIIIFDMPPLLAADDVMAFFPCLDTIMLVVEHGKTTKSDLQRAYELLTDKAIIGTVLNKSEDLPGNSGLKY